jgi:hypothetical protein
MHTDTGSETTLFNISNYLYTTYITAQAHATQETKPNTKLSGIYYHSFQNTFYYNNTGLNFLLKNINIILHITVNTNMEKQQLTG